MTLNTWNRLFSIWKDMGSRVAGWLLACMALLIAASPVWAEVSASSPPKKFALIIANSKYQTGSLTLKNPENDAKLLGQSFSKLGFDVRLAYDLNRSRLASTVSDFASSLPAGSTSVIFFAGHGMQIGGASYLLPVDMTVTSEQSVPLRAYPLKTMLESVSSSQASVNIVVLDACRDNPFQPPPATRYRGINPLGLGSVVAPRGTFIAYSTAPGQLAADGNAANSLYTSTLSKVLMEPGLSLETIFRKVGDQVRKQTLDDQIPWFESSINADYYFLPPSGVTVAAGATLQTSSSKRTDGTAYRSVTAKSKPQRSEWYRTMSEYEWSDLDYQIQQRVKYMTLDEVPEIEFRARGGSVVAQMTLAMFWLEGPSRANTVGDNKVVRYGANNTRGVQWLRMAAKAGFPIAQVNLGEMLYQGHYMERDKAQARVMLTSAAQANYPRAKLDLFQLDAEDGKLTGNSAQEVVESMIKSLSIPK